jgi:hypothetical protein
MVASSSYGPSATYNDLFDDVATQMRFFCDFSDFAMQRTNACASVASAGASAQSSQRTLSIFTQFCLKGIHHGCAVSR